MQHIFFCIPIMTSKDIFSSPFFSPPLFFCHHNDVTVMSALIWSFMTLVSLVSYVISVHIYLHNAIGPSLSDSVPCPNIVPIFRQLLHQLVLIGCQFDMIEVQRSRFVPTAHHITDQETEKYVNQNLIHLQDKSVFFRFTYVLGSLIFLRFSSAFSSPMPTWHPRAKRVLERSRRKSWWINRIDRRMHKQWTSEIWDSTDTHFKVSPDIWRL